MIDIELIRNNKKLVIESEQKRFRETKIVEEVFNFDEIWRKKKYELDQIQKRMNALQKEIKENIIKQKGMHKNVLPGTSAEKRLGGLNIAESASVSASVSASISDKLVEERNALKKEQEERLNEVNELMNKIKCKLSKIGNIVKSSVPVSDDEKDNELIRQFVSKRTINKTYGYPDLFRKINGCDTEKGARIAGHRGYYLFGDTALLGMSLTRYAIDFMQERGFLLVQTPVFMSKEVMSKTAQLSDFDDQLYHLEGDNYLIATSEQPLTALHMNENVFELPKKYVGHSLCFRKEAGAHGKDNQGIFRVHQFEKVEQFVICNENESDKYFNEMINVVEEFYKSLDISFNVVSIVSGELNDAAAIKYDIECLFPNTGKFRELVSCSNCTDYQSRDLEIREGFGKDSERKVYVHMLNCTVVAVQRMLCCILENYQAEDGIIIPEPLLKYFGKSKIPFKN